VIYRFDEFEVDDREFRLSANGATVQVEPKVLRLLLYLIENRNRLVRKQELLDRVWPDAMVTENALTRVVGLLRKALNDDSHVPRFIETVPTAGYRFIARVTVAEQNPVVAPLAPTGTTLATATSATRFRASRKWTFAAVILLLAAVGGGIFLFARHRRQAVHEKATVVLTDFDNATGDPVFDGTLRQWLAVRLEQSPFLTLMSDERMQLTLRMMGQPANARLSPAIARELCVRSSSALVVDGSIASLGSQYVLGLRATDCRSGKVIAQEQVQAARKEDVLGALDGIASKLRAQAGESLTTAEKYDTPIWEATTPSMEALRFYTLGQKKAYGGESAAALLFFLRAVELDPNFASAYTSMSLIYSNRQEPERAADAIRKAYELRDRVNEGERRVIEANYYVLATGELEKAEHPLNVLKETFPGAPQPHTNLGGIYRRLGNPQKAMEEANEALRREPSNPLNYQNLGADYVSLNRLDEADALYKEAETRRLVNERSARSRYLLAFLKGDEAQMAHFATSTAGMQGEEDSMLAAQADTAAWFGRLNEARELTRRAIDSAHRNDVQETAGVYQAEIALFEADSGNRQQSRADADAAMKLAPTRNVRPMAALALARSGDTAAAEKLANELDKSFPRGTLVQEYWLPAIRAAVALQHKDPNRAIGFLQVASAVELSSPRLLPAYLRGEAYLMLHDGDRAAAEFQKFLDHRGLVRNAPWGGLARLGLARAYAMQGDTLKARTAYQDFLALWKDADPDITILKQAKAELTKLQ
jgi:DNA-binding winged helix-turn-helix (wHTH) protein/tetratricopeptide (TPR) repeat protein